MAVEYEVNGRPRAEEVRALVLSVGWRDPARHGLELVQRVWDQAPCTVLARDEGKLVGMCRAYWDGGLRAEIKNVAVHPDYQHQGIGTRLMELLLEELDRLQVRRVTLDSGLGKDKFYERFGFEVRTWVTPMTRSYKEKESDECCSR